MTTRAILPIKNFSEAKSRLATQLNPGPRRALAEAMFSDVLTALRRSKAVDDVVVVSSDTSAQQIAGGHGAGVLEDSGSGHSEAALVGIRDALEAGIERVICVPGDCPMLDPTELDALLSRDGWVPGQRGALIVPDRHGDGTNALVISPPDALAPAFGPDSRARHVSLAEQAAITFEVVEVPTLAIDIDTPEDLAELRRNLAQRFGGSAHTRGMLNQLDRSRL